MEVSPSLAHSKCEPDGRNDARSEYFHGILFTEAFPRRLSKRHCWKAITSKEMSLKKPKEADGHFSPRLLCSVFEWMKKRKKKKNIQTTVNGEFRLLWKDFLGRWRSLATLRAMEIHRTCVDQRIWTDWLPPVSKETSLPVGLYQHRDFWSHRLYISH